jgi:Protein of unknown function (DUF3489)
VRQWRHAPALLGADFCAVRFSRAFSYVASPCVAGINGPRKLAAPHAMPVSRRDGWQSDSVRGFISGALGKKLCLKVESSRDEKNNRVYRIA